MPKVKWYTVLEFDDVLCFIVCTYTLILCTALTIGYIFQGEPYKTWAMLVPPMIFAVIGLVDKKGSIENRIAMRQLEFKIGIKNCE